MDVEIYDESRIVRSASNCILDKHMNELPQPAVVDLDLPTVLAALADPVRLAIVRELHDRREVMCGALHLDVAKSTRSHHLKVLREAGVTWTRVEGVERYVTLRYTCLDKRFPGLLTSVLGSIPNASVR